MSTNQTFRAASDAATNGSAIRRPSWPAKDFAFVRKQQNLTSDEFAATSNAVISQKAKDRIVLDLNTSDVVSSMSFALYQSIGNIDNSWQPTSEDEKAKDWVILD